MLRQIWGKRESVAQTHTHIPQMPIVEKGCPAILWKMVDWIKILLDGVSY